MKNKTQNASDRVEKKSEENKAERVDEKQRDFSSNGRHELATTLAVTAVRSTAKWRDCDRIAAQ